MNTMKKMTRTGAILAVTWTLAGAAYAADAEGKVRIGDADAKARVEVDADRDRDRDRLRATTDADHKDALRSDVMENNKASSIIGMTVQNRAGEKLGEIQDLVIDMNSGKISYAVLSVGGFLGIGEKYIAVPPSAFEFAAADKKLVLNADKSKIERAHGFAKTNWPNVENPQWGAEGLWTSDKADRDGKVDVDVNLDADRNRTRLDKDATDLRRDTERRRD